MAAADIVVRGAREHNLRNVDLVIPRNKLVVMSGVSGSGKSSLAFDTVYAEGQRRYVESLSTYARHFLGQMPKPEVDSITGLAPSISIQQKATSRNPRSTVGTITEIYDYLRVLYARVGQGCCTKCHQPITAQSIDQILESVLTLPEGTRYQILAPLVQKIPFDPDKLLVPVTNVGTGAQVAAVKASLPVKTLTEFLAYARANPGKLNFAVAGVNNISHLAPVLLFKRAGVELAMVPSRGEPQAITDLMSGSVDFYFGNASVLLNSDREKLRILAAGTAQRLAVEPELPTISETFPNFVFQSWNGFFVPKGTPNEMISRLRNAVAELVATPDMKQRLLGLGIVPGGQTEDEVAAAFKADRESFAEAVSAAGIKKP